MSRVSGFSRLATTQGVQPVRGAPRWEWLKQWRPRPAVVFVLVAVPLYLVGVPLWIMVVKPMVYDEDEYMRAAIARETRDI